MSPSTLPLSQTATNCGDKAGSKSEGLSQGWSSWGGCGIVVNPYPPARGSAPVISPSEARAKSFDAFLVLQVSSPAVLLCKTVCNQLINLAYCRIVTGAAKGYNLSPPVAPAVPTPLVSTLLYMLCACTSAARNGNVLIWNFSVIDMTCTGFHAV